MNYSEKSSLVTRQLEWQLTFELFLIATEKHSYSRSSIYSISVSEIITVEIISS